MGGDLGNQSTHTPKRKSRLIFIFFFGIYFVVLNQCCTQYLAHIFHYSSSLGSNFKGIYPFFSWFPWVFKFYDYAPSRCNVIFVLFCLGVLIGLVGFTLWVGFSSRSNKITDDLHGSARFATFDEIQEMGLIPYKKKGEGVYCGVFSDPKKKILHYLCHDGPEHIIALAPTRSGKGVGLVVPTLLSWPHSLFVLDIKGENYAVTAGWRKMWAGNKILRFDPAEPEVGCSWNPLGEIRFRTRYQVADAQNIALMLIDDDGKGIDGDHFRSAAFELLNGLILHALYKAEKIGRVSCLQDCAYMLTGVGDFAAVVEHNDDFDDEGDPKALSALFHEMKTLDIKSDDPLFQDADKEAKLVINGVGFRMSGTPACELEPIISMANHALSLYRDPIVGENTKYCDFYIRDLMDAENPVSLYFIITPRNLNRMRPLARLLLTQMVLSLSSNMEFVDGRSKTSHKHRLLLMLDEFPILGKLDIFEKALSYIAESGIKAYIIAQNMQQLYKVYSRDESIISNCHIRIAYAPNTVETAEWISKMAGVTTVVREKVSTSGKRFGMVLEQVSTSYEETRRPLMTPDEIMRLPRAKKDNLGNIVETGEMLIFVAGNSVIRGTKILYFLDPVFSERSKISPPVTDRLHQRHEIKEGKKGFVI
ncbi:type IV secretory system conjugative DNA transfer family protein [Bartonella taylorii]|uniref:type IV secretory system conjugative DNA transfer family protein n=1 Tax=Bartonella taylorii TaxID=33046 RepID=UPI001ABB391C|nr:type IV secretory system conjugative DNA transfer family protein [Bartonella taylorii]